MSVSDRQAEFPEKKIRALIPRPGLMEGEASTETVAVAIPKCRNKSKGGVALSDADKAIEDAD